MDAPGPVPGFTLVETMASLAVLAIILGLALPGFRGTLERHRVASAMHLVSAQLAQARNTAITRRSPVSVCPSRGDGRCLGLADWSGGWLVYLDPERTDQPAGVERVLRDVRHPVHESIQISATDGRQLLRYQPDGRSGGHNLTLRVCSAGRLHGEVIVNNVGRTRTRSYRSDAPCPPP